MDLIKKLTGKNPSEYEPIAKSLVDNSDTELFEKLVKQDDFLFDFIKDNVARRIQKACNKDNYKNLIPLMKHYSPSYDTMFGEVINSFGGKEIYSVMRDLFLNGTNDEKAYAAKYLTFYGKFEELLPKIREYSKSEFPPLGVNSIELLSMLNDEVSKNEAISKLDSNDEFEQFEGIKFLVNFGAKDALPKIVEVMKKSGLSESIASEIPYLVPFDELINNDKETACLVLCHIINAIPEIISPSSVSDYDMYSLFERLLNDSMTSTSALALIMAKDKFNELITNDEYLYDCDKNTKDSIKAINELLKNLVVQKLKSYLYEELYEDSDFVFFALDYVDEVEELETLLDSKNQTLVLKVLILLKEKGLLSQTHKDTALNAITSDDLKLVAQSL